MDNKSAIIRFKRAGLRNCEIVPLLHISKQYVSRISRIADDADCQVKKRGSNGYVTIGMASQILGLHESSIRRWADSGKLPSFRLEGTRGDRRFRLVDLRDFMKKTDLIGSSNGSSNRNRNDIN